MAETDSSSAPRAENSARDAARVAALEEWEQAARHASWMRSWTKVWEPDPPFDHWFVDGQLNVSVNCLDRHLAEHGERIAIYWEGEPGDRRAISYAQLHADVVVLTRALRSIGVGSNDRVALHLGSVPEAFTAILACARIGAVYMTLPTPLPVEALIQRLTDFDPKVLFTQDGAWRRGAIIPLKAHIDDAISAVPGVEKTIVVRRTGVDVNWYEGDLWYHNLFTEARPGAVRADTSAAESPAQLPAEHPLAIEALANRRGHAVSVTHASARLLLCAAVVHRFGSCGTGTSWIAGEASWLATQASGLFGPLFWGQTTVIYEGALDTPNRQRAWDIIERYQVQTLMLSPSAAEILRQSSYEPQTAQRISSLKRFTSVGEQADRSLMQWFADLLGPGTIQVADGWGQIQLGGVICFDSPIDAQNLPDPRLQIVDDDGAPVGSGQVGELVVTAPWAGTVQNVHGEAAQDVVDTHWGRPGGVYATGDLARYDADGGIDFLGRRDEVVPVSGQLVSLTEIRNVLREHPYVQNADAFEVRSQMSRTYVMAAVVIDSQMASGLADNRLRDELLEGVREMIGGLGRPRRVMFVDRFGDELTRSQRRDALAILAAAERRNDAPVRITWSQVLAAAGVASES